MRPLGSSDVLSAWEEGRQRSSTHRALVILWRAFPELSPEDVSGLPLGARADLLLQVYGQNAGPKLDGVCVCPKCAAQVAVSVDIAELTRRAQCAIPPIDIDVGRRRFRFRPPSSDDLLAIRACGSAEEAREALLARCIIEPEADDAASARLPDEAVAELERQLGDCDPLAEIVLDLTCPDCGVQWRAELDVVDFVWEALDGRARQLLFDIDALARAYGWSEPEILALSPARRGWYVDRVS